MAVAFDAVSESERTDTSDPMTWTHTPVGTPRGVVVLIGHGTSSTLHVSSVTYGGVTMTRIERGRDQSGEAGAVEAYFLGDVNIPTGAQTVSVDLSTATTDDIHGVCFTVTAATCTEASYFRVLTDDQANPQAVMKKGGHTGISFAMLYTGTDDPGGTLASGNTLGPTMDGGTWATQTCYETTPDASDHTIGWSTLASDDTVMMAVTVEEMSLKPVVQYEWASASVTSATAISTTGAFTNDHDQTLWIANLAISGTTDPSITPPAGWTQIGSTISSTAGNGIWHSLWYYVQGGDTTLSDVFTWTGNRAARMQVSFASGLDSSDIIEVAAVTATGSGGGGVSITSSAPTSDGAMFYGAFASAPATTGWVHLNNDYGFINILQQFSANTVGLATYLRWEPSTDTVTLDPLQFDFNGDTVYTAFLIGLKPRSVGIWYADSFATSNSAATTINRSTPSYSAKLSDGLYGFSAGDVIIADVVAVSAGDVSFNTPSGWTKIGSTDVVAATAVTGGVNRASWYKVLDDDDLGATHAFSWTGTCAANVSLFQYKRGSAAPLDVAVTQSATGLGTAPAVTAAGGSTRKYTAFQASLGYLNTTSSTPQDGFDRGANSSAGVMRHRRAASISSTQGRVAHPGWTLAVGSPWALRVNAIMSLDEFGAVADTETFNVGVLGTRTKLGVVQLSELLSISTDGQKGIQSVVHVVDTISTSAKQGHFGSVSLAETLGVATAADVTRFLFGAAQLDVAPGITVVGTSARAASVAMEFDFDVFTGGGDEWTLVVVDDVALSMAAGGEAQTLSLAVRQEEELF